MNYNILSYIIFGTISIYIILGVGQSFYRNGRIFIFSLFQGRSDLTDTTNKILLVAYYLFNIGYAVLQFSFWNTVYDLNTLIASIAYKTGILILLLAGLHFNNMLIIYLLSKKQNLFIHP